MTETVAVKVDESRREFEAWYSKFYSIPGDWIIEHRHYERYVPYSSGIDLQWMAWKASRAALVVEPPKAEFFLVWDGKKHSTTFREATERYSAVLRAAGITVKGDSDGK